MLILNRVVVTGGLSCGKSSVCHLFKTLGAHVVSADEIVHQLLSPKTPLGLEVIKLIGSDIVVNERIDRGTIAKRVFEKPDLLDALEKLLHPAVQDAIEREYQQLMKEGKRGLFVAEIPLFFESKNSGNFFDASIAVLAPEALCKARFTQATGYDEKEFEKRMARQMRPEEKAKRATYVIHNNGSWEDLQSAVQTLYKQLTR